MDILEMRKQLREDFAKLHGQILSRENAVYLASLREVVWGGSDESVIKLFNPYHDPGSGQFTTGTDGVAKAGTENDHDYKSDKRFQKVRDAARKHSIRGAIVGGVYGFCKGAETGLVSSAVVGSIAGVAAGFAGGWIGGAISENIAIEFRQRFLGKELEHRLEDSQDGEKKLWRGLMQYLVAAVKAGVSEISLGESKGNLSRFGNRQISFGQG